MTSAFKIGAMNIDQSVQCHRMVFGWRDIIIQTKQTYSLCIQAKNILYIHGHIKRTLYANYWKINYSLGFRGHKDDQDLVKAKKPSKMKKKWMSPPPVKGTALGGALQPSSICSTAAALGSAYWAQELGDFQAPHAPAPSTHPQPQV